MRRIAVIVAMLAAGLEPAARAQDGDALYNDEDLMFLRHMSIHHEQALTMSALVPERTERARFEQFARFVSRAQATEIDLMESLLDVAAERGLDVPEHGPHGDPPMAGMLSSADMDALEAASGAEFERLWLEGMIFHHEGGLAMARAQQLQQLEHGRRPYGLNVLVEDILIEQRAEITKMRGWLDEWGLTRDAVPDTSAPRAAVTSPTPGASVPAGMPTTFVGLALDQGDVAAVRVAVQDLATQRWWRQRGGWGEHAAHSAEITRSGPSSVAWRFEWTPPTAGRYAIRVEAEDAAGNRGTSMMLREFSAR